MRFAEPIVLEDGSQLATLRDAIAHLAKLIPKAERNMPEILTASDLLTNAAEHGGPVEFARIATLQAINRHVGGVFDSITQRHRLGAPQAEEGPMKTVWIYVDTSKDVGDLDHLKVFANPEAADEWFKEHDPEGVVFEYEVIDGQEAEELDAPPLDS